MDNVQKHVEEVQEQIIERSWCNSQMEERLVRVQLGKHKIATRSHVLKKVSVQQSEGYD